MTEWIDVTVPIRQGMVCFPDNPGVRIASTEEVHNETICRISHLSLGVHTGTHFDAPNHFGVPGGGVEALPLEGLVGAARVVEVRGAAVDSADVDACDPSAGERLLFKTKNSARCWSTDEFIPDYTYLTFAAALQLAARRVRTVGIDYLSMGGPRDGAATHQVLLEAGICILEGLDLSRVSPGSYELVALPLLIPGSDGAPARVLLRPRA